MKATILDYVDWRGDLSFKASKFNEVDNVVFSMLSYLDFKKTMTNAKSTYPTLDLAIETFFTEYDYKTYRFGAILPNTIKDLAKKVQKTKRYGQILILDYANEIDHEEKTQFGACAYLLDDSTILVCFEGTDDTLCGWYEDGYMFVTKETIAQRKSVLFLERVAKLFPNKKINVCGHSKGGNLAYYSVMKASDDIKERIIHTYNTDGPGLLYDRYEESEYKIIDEKGITILPNSAIVGSIFEMRGEIRIVQSRVKNAYQHDPFELVVLGDKLIRADKFTKSALNIQKELQKYVFSVKAEDAKRCMDELYMALYNDNKRTLLDLKFTDFSIINKLVKLVKTDKDVIKKFVAILINNNAFIK